MDVPIHRADAFVRSYDDAMGPTTYRVAITVKYSELQYRGLSMPNFDVVVEYVKTESSAFGPPSESGTEAIRDAFIKLEAMYEGQDNPSLRLGGVTVRSDPFLSSKSNLESCDPITVTRSLSLLSDATEFTQEVVDSIAEHPGYVAFKSFHCAKAEAPPKKAKLNFDAL